ncbi:Benzoate--CoA ligase [compost metagenome]
MSPDVSIGEAELIAHCRSCLAHYKVPARVIVGDLSKTATGKVRKFELREHALRLASKDAATPID